MINANELRIGNKLNFVVERRRNPINRIVDVCIIDYSKIVVKDMGLEVSFVDNDESLRPIPLTPELLISIGFSDIVSRTTQLDCSLWESHRYEFIKDKTSLSINIGKEAQFEFQKSDHNLIWFTNKDDPFNNRTNLFKHIFFLHQLQNLYFVLTGKELEINL